MSIVADINGDNRADVVCITDDGGIMIYEAKDVETFYEPGTVWSDEAFGFCTNSPKRVYYYCRVLCYHTEKARISIQ